MSYKMYSVEDIAKHLGLHRRTVRNYVRSGLLKAIRIGKQYRIAAEDLSALTGRPESIKETWPVQRHVEASSIIEIDAVNPELANRLTNLLMSATQNRGNEEQHRVETIYDERRSHMKVILVGSMSANSKIFELIQTILEAS